MARGYLLFGQILKAYRGQASLMPELVVSVL
jgi:hypothetical protein